MLMRRPTESPLVDPSTAAPRRIVLQEIAVAGIGLAALAGTGRYGADARKKKRCRKNKKKKSGSVTCADVCPIPGGLAFHLFDRGDVCATGADITGCIDCTSGADCLAADPLRSFCVRDFTNLATGADGDFSVLCGAYPRGLCAAFEPCVLDA
jgi:hypothetical protein